LRLKNNCHSEQTLLRERSERQAMTVMNLVVKAQGTVNKTLHCGLKTTVIQNKHCSVSAANGKQ
jgi:hypothetical protein